MRGGTGSGEPDAVEALSADLERVADRLRTLSEARLRAPVPGWGSRAEAARALAQRCADAAAGVAGEPSRTVPTLSDLAVGDQVAVCGHDLVAALRAPGTAGSDVSGAVAAVRTELDALRRAL